MKTLYRRWFAGRRGPGLAVLDALDRARPGHGRPLSKRGARGAAVLTALLLLALPLSGCGMWLFAEYLTHDKRPTAAPSLPVPYARDDALAAGQPMTAAALAAAIRALTDEDDIRAVERALDNALAKIQRERRGWKVAEG